MKNLLRIAILSLIIFYSCVSVRFPETIKVDITIPSDFDIDKMQILIDTLKGLNKKDQNKIMEPLNFFYIKQKSKKKKMEFNKKV